MGYPFPIHLAPLLLPPQKVRLAYRLLDVPLWGSFQIFELTITRTTINRITVTRTTKNRPTVSGVVLWYKVGPRTLRYATRPPPPIPATGFQNTIRDIAIPFTKKFHTEKPSGSRENVRTPPMVQGEYNTMAAGGFIWEKQDMDEAFGRHYLVPWWLPNFDM